MFGLDRRTVAKMLAYSASPGYRRSKPRARPKLDAFTGIIDRILEDDQGRPVKQRHTAKRIFDRLREEYGFDGEPRESWAVDRLRGEVFPTGQFGATFDFSHKLLGPAMATGGSSQIRWFVTGVGSKTDIGPRR